MKDAALNLLSLAKELEALILRAVPEATTLSKYGGTLFTLKPDEKEGQFCGVFIYSGHVHLAFSQGARLDDPKKLLAGQGKYRRHVNLKSLDEIDGPYLEGLLQAASRL
ncbi:DUF1801 domain-containing protein [Marinospirillum perlucidum]|uniref:DUF1801 domain-containing protein n=1 Tax=Marinospirillum perlucidum TaxID=1982602 RepID=UPI0013904671|nr:DUF1801 domain-containing protein [Marinospirillum perlucidum]